MEIASRSIKRILSGVTRMYLIRPAAVLAAFVLAVAAAAPAGAAAPAISVGSKLDELTVGTSTYHGVEIRSINAHTLIITHARGMTSLKLSDLTPEWQSRFGYHPMKDVAPSLPTLSAHAHPAPRPTPQRQSKVEQLLSQFGQPAVLEAAVDLRPKFFELELVVKNQGRRPSCAIFAIVSCLEFQNADLTGHAEKLSDEYLSWATRKIAQRPAAPASPVAEDAPAMSEDADEGFTLTEVVTALRGYGIPLQATMPNTFGRSLASIGDPPAAVVAEARQRQRVFVHTVPGHDSATRINNMIHALNAGIPVSVGMAWPSYRALRGGYINSQKPEEGSGHAVTVVGYKAPEGRREDTVFIFKNSWGSTWGQGGYGLVTYRYLEKYLGEAVLLELQPNSPAHDASVMRSP